MKKVEWENSEVFRLLLSVCEKYRADPSASIESEAFYRKLLEEYDGEYDMKQLRAWLDNRISKLYIALKKRPRWIQSEVWPFYNGKPMTFVGQIDISPNHSAEADARFHDDTSFYIFMVDGTSIYEVIVQQY